MGNGDRRYSPRSSDTLLTDGICRAGLVAVTVTPGRTAPELSVTKPEMPAGLPPPWPTVASAADENSVTTKAPMATTDVEKRTRAMDLDMWPSSMSRLRTPASATDGRGVGWWRA